MEAPTSDSNIVNRAITVAKPADELYRFWREPDNLARIMGHFAEVTAGTAQHAHWVVRAPLGKSLEWDTELFEDEPGKQLRWRAINGPLPHEGSVGFRSAPGGRGTEVMLHLHFDPPGGALGDAVAKLLGAVPRVIADSALRRLKSLAEAGEIPTIEHNPSARASAADA